MKLWRPQHKADSLGLLYYNATACLGFRPNRHEGKVLGLAAFGQPVHAEELRRHYRVLDDGQICANVKDSSKSSPISSG